MRIATAFVAALLGVLTACGPEPGPAYATYPDFNDDWEFTLAGHDTRTVDLPHDWSVEFPFDSVAGEGATGYLPGGLGTYVKRFPSPPGGVTYLLFDGVYNNATVRLNNRELGFHPYGYSPFYYDVSTYLLRDGRPNVLEVEVDHRRYADSRWYTGSGIYRPVELINVDPLHIPVWGTFVTTPEVTEAGARVQCRIEVANAAGPERTAELRATLLDPAGNPVAEETQTVALRGNSQRTFTQQLRLPDPARWDVDEPNLYTAVFTLREGGRTVHETRTPFGVRTFRFDAETGFWLNGRNRKIKGVCLHHDGGLVGAAVPRAVWRRRLATLKAGGCNAIRISHNPGSQEFLDLCDEMGFLVQDEFFDEWDYPKDKRLNMQEQRVDSITRGYVEHFQEWAQRDLEATVLAHRNHPSIIQWSIGNEIEWTYPREKVSTGFFDADWSGNYFWNTPPKSIEQIRERQQNLPRQRHQIGETATKLADWTRALDTTRPVVANMILPSASYESGYADALDVAGYSYRRVMYDYGHENYPDLPVMGTENLAQYHEWKAVEERPFVAGTFLWTGIEYLGESNNSWPKKQTTSGMLDLAGFPKGSYYMMKGLWTEAPTLRLYTQTEDKSTFRRRGKRAVEKKPGGWQRALWTWQDVNPHYDYPTPGQPLVAEAYGNTPEAELFLNGRSLGRQRLADHADHIYKWPLDYAPGTLRLVGYAADGSEATHHELITPGEATAVTLTEEYGEGGVTHLVAQLTDADGRPVRADERRLSVTLAGQGRLLGVDNGAATNTDPFQGGSVVTHYGRALAIIKLTAPAAPPTVTVTADGLPPATLQLTPQEPAK